MSVQKDIYIQDKMANGLVEAPRAKVISSSLKTESTTGSQRTSDVKSDTGASRVSKTTDQSNTSNGKSKQSTPDIKASPSPSSLFKGLKIKSSGSAQKNPPVRNYIVTIVNSNSIISSKAQSKLAFKELNSAVFTDDDTVDKNDKISGAQITSRYEATNYNPALSLIHEERDSQYGDSNHQIMSSTLSPLAPKVTNDSGTSNDVVHIQPKKRQKSKSACVSCVIL
jgi:hypothetical protein